MGFKSKAVAVATGDTDVYQMGAGLVGAVVLGIGNVTGGALTYSVKFFKQSTGLTTVLASGKSIAANDFKKFEIPISLEAGDKIVMSGSAAGVTAFTTVTDSASASPSVGWTPRGTYSAVAIYAKNDIVSGSDGGSYISMVDGNTGNDPTASPAQWMVNSLRGPAGPTGISGTPIPNQIATFNTGTTIQGVSITGLVKGNGASAPSAAVPGTDYLAPPGGAALLKANAGGPLSNASPGSDYVAPGTASAFTAQQGFTLATLSDGATINWNVAVAQKAKVTLGGNRTMAAVTNAVEGTTYSLWVVQDGTGSRALAFTTTGAGSFDFNTRGVPILTTTAGAADLLCFEALTLGGTLKLRYAGMIPGAT